ncbi:IS30 family transposase [Streptomyces mirabilis]|uniref:IS30 family transposase n=1 Tax=Streptomyces mirabilis TaxID=68239 RepID=UPI0036E164B5
MSREVRRNSDSHTGKYHPLQAQRRAAVGRARSKDGKIRRDPELKEFIQQRLDRRWSPEQICQALHTAFPDEPERHLAHETVYQAVYLPHRGGLERTPGLLRSGRPARRRRRRPDERATRFIDPGTLISYRPEELNDRQIAGSWEGDLIVSKGNRSAIGTLVDRSTRYVKLLHLPGGRGAEQVRDALVHAFGDLPAELARSVTWDLMLPPKVRRSTMAAKTARKAPVKKTAKKSAAAKKPPGGSGAPRPKSRPGWGRRDAASAVAGQSRMRSWASGLQWVQARTPELRSRRASSRGTGRRRLPAA